MISAAALKTDRCTRCEKVATLGQSIRIEGAGRSGGTAVWIARTWCEHCIFDRRTDILRMDLPIAAPAACALFSGGKMSPSGARDWRRRRRRCTFERRGVEDMNGRRVLEATIVDRTVLARTVSTHFS